MFDEACSKFLSLKQPERSASTDNTTYYLMAKEYAPADWSWRMTALVSSSGKTVEKIIFVSYVRCPLPCDVA